LTVTALAAVGLAAAGAAGHPTWHLVVVALAAIAVFVGIKIEEHLRARPRTHRHRAVARSGLLLFVAGCSAGAAAVHASVCSDHFRESFAFGVFFVIAAALQAVWAVLVCVRPTRALLVAGAAGNASLVLVWALSRTVGLPIGPEIWHPEPVSMLDMIATLLEVALVVGAAAVVRTSTRALPPSRRRRTRRSLALRDGAPPDAPSFATSRGRLA
jgi:hypothetical protein